MHSSKSHTNMHIYMHANTHTTLAILNTHTQKKGKTDWFSQQENASIVENTRECFNW